MKIILKPNPKTSLFFIHSHSYFTLQNNRSFCSKLKESHTREAREHHTPISLSVLNLAPDLLIDCSRVLEYRKKPDCFSFILKKQGKRYLPRSMVKSSQVAYLHGYKGMVSFLFLQMSCTIDIILLDIGNVSQICQR